MTAKIILATALNFFETSQSKEDELNRRAIAMRPGSKKALPLRKEYALLYHQLMHELDGVNHLYHNVDRYSENPAHTNELKRYCESLLITHMNRANALKQNECGLLLPVDQVCEVEKKGYTRQRVLYRHDGVRCGLKDITPLQNKVHLTPGSFMLCIWNSDDYLVNAPEVRVTVSIKDSQHPQQVLQQVVMPSQCALVRTIGTVHPAVLSIDVTTTAGMRKSHITVELHELVSAADQMLSDLPDVVTGRRPAAVSDNHNTTYFHGDSHKTSPLCHWEESAHRETDGDHQQPTAADEVPSSPVEGDAASHRPPPALPHQQDITPIDLLTNQPLRLRLNTVTGVVMHTWGAQQQPLQHSPSPFLTADEQRLAVAIANLPNPNSVSPR